MNKRSPKTTPPLKALNAFEVAARYGSFTKAAEELLVTPTAVRHHVKQLEEWLGFLLFRRTGNSLILTDRGAQYAGLLTKAFAMIMDATDVVSGPEAETTLTVSARPNFSLRWLVPRLSGFADRYPNIQVRLLTSYTDLDTLVDEVDVAIFMGNARDEIDCTYLFHSDRFPVCSPGYLRRHPLKELADLESATILNVESQLDEWPAWFRSVGIDPAPEIKGPRFDTMAMALEAAATGLGVALGSTAFVGDELKTQRLVAPFHHKLATQSAYHLAVMPYRQSPATDRFKTWLLQQVAPLREPDSGAIEN